MRQIEVGIAEVTRALANREFLNVAIQMEMGRLKSAEKRERRIYLQRNNHTSYARRGRIDTGRTKSSIDVEMDATLGSKRRSDQQGRKSRPRSTHRNQERNDGADRKLPTSVKDSYRR